MNILDGTCKKQVCTGAEGEEGGVGVSSAPDAQQYSLQDALYFNGTPITVIILCPPGANCTPGTYITRTYPPGTFYFLKESTVAGRPIRLSLKGCESRVSVTLPAGASPRTIRGAVNYIFEEVARQEARCSAYIDSLMDFIQLSEIKPNYLCLDQPGDIVITGTANPPIYPLTFEIVGDIPGMNSFSQNQRQQFISGTPTTPGNYTFTVRATNEAGIVGQRAYTLSVVGFTTDALPGATAGEPYEAFILTTGMAGNLTWGIAYGSLPDGLILNSTTGAIFGIADTIGDYSFSIFVQNGVQQCFKEFEISVTNCFSSPSPTLTDATQYVLASYQMVPVESPEAGFVWNYTIVSGSIPTGMSLGLTTGLLSGTPTASGDFLFTVEITQVPI